MKEIMKDAAEFTKIAMMLHMSESEKKAVLDIHNGDVKAAIRTLKAIKATLK